MKIHNMPQQSPEWYALRAGMPTASCFSNLVTSKGEPSKSMTKYALTLAAEGFAGKGLDEFSTLYMERGIEMEAAAKQAYEFVTDNALESVGFITDDAETCGCSPDGLVGNDGLAEFKCLKAENHLSAILRWRKGDGVDPTYIQQVQGQMMIAERKWCDLVFYHPDLPILIIRTESDAEFHDALQKQIAAVIIERDRIIGEMNAFVSKAA